MYLADTDLRLGCPFTLERVTRSTSDLHGHTTDTVGIVPIQVPMPDGQHSAIEWTPRRFARIFTRDRGMNLPLCPLPLVAGDP